MNPYRTLIFAHLVQESALTVGGNRPHEMVDLPLARDGLGRPVIRGTTLAGLFIATARTLVDSLPRAISCGGIEAQHQNAGKPLVPSAWRFANAHLLADKQIVSQFHQHVSIDERTLAAKDDHLFSVESTPPGSLWCFQLEIAPSDETDFATLQALAAQVLALWRQKGGVRIGRGSRHGYGWCHLEEIQVVPLQAHHIALWPNAFSERLDPQGWIDYFRRHDVTVLDFDAWLDRLQERGLVVSPQRKHWVELSGTIEVGERQDPFGQGYGLDTLSIGGHAALYQQAKMLFERIIPPPENLTWTEETFDPDFVITVRPNAQGKLEPYIPGASIRGVWRAALYRHYRALGKELSPLAALFGSTDSAGRLSVSDATALDDDWKLIWQQHVAIDEFTGGAYGAAKFDRLAIARGRFGWRATIEGDSPAHAQALAQNLVALIQALGEGHLPIGGGIWHGHGHIRWRLDSQTPQTVTV